MSRDSNEEGSCGPSLTPKYFLCAVKREMGENAVVTVKLLLN